MFLFTPKWFDSAKGLEHLTWVHQAFVRIGLLTEGSDLFVRLQTYVSLDLKRSLEALESVFVFISNSQTVPYQSSRELITQVKLSHRGMLQFGAKKYSFLFHLL